MGKEPKITVNVVSPKMISVDLQPKIDEPLRPESPITLQMVAAVSPKMLDAGRAAQAEARAKGYFLWEELTLIYTAMRKAESHS
jgi:hypothetical protein